MTRLTFAFIPAIALTLTAGSAHATNYSFWDGATDTPAGGQISPNGTWENANWSTVTGTTTPTNSAVDPTQTQAFVESGDMHLCAGTNSTGAYTITANGNHTVGAFDLDTVGNCTINGTGALAFTSTGDGFKVVTGGMLTISNGLSASSSSFLNWTSGNGTLTLAGNCTFPAFTSSSQPNILVATAGTLVLSGANTFGGNSSYGSVDMRANGATLVLASDHCIDGSGANGWFNMGVGNFGYNTTIMAQGGNRTIQQTAASTSLLMEFNGPTTIGGNNQLTLSGKVYFGSATTSPHGPYVITCNNLSDTIITGASSSQYAYGVAPHLAGSGRFILAGPVADQFNAGTPFFLDGGYLGLAKAGAINTSLQINAPFGQIESINAAQTVTVPLTFTNVSSDFTLVGNYPLTFSGNTTLSPNVGDVATMANSTTNDLTLSGTISGAGGLFLDNSGRIVFSKSTGNTYTGTTFNSGSILKAANTSGSATGTGTVQNSGILTGPGIFGPVTMNPSGSLVPGDAPNLGTATLTTGAEIWNSGGNYTWNINSGTGTAGTSSGWDLVLVNGPLTINGGSFTITITITSLAAGNVAGALAGLTPGTTYTWRILTASGGISGFSPSAFNLNTGNFSSAFNGSFAISQNGNDLDLIFTASPVIASNPQGQTVDPGNSVAFTVGAAGAQPLVYQWFHNGAPIAGASTSSYNINSAQATDAGTYFVTVTNSYGSATSSNAILYVTGNPFIVINPLSQTNFVGGTVTFSVLSSGSAPLFYTWYYNDSPNPIPNAINLTSNTFTLTGLQLTNAGKYSVDVANGFADALSSDAVLTVNPFVPAHFTSISIPGNPPGVNLVAVGNVGGVYNIQDSTNLTTTNWTVLGTLTNTNGIFQYLDTTATNKSQRFYRTQLAQ